MKTKRPSKWKTVLAAFLFSGVFSLTQARTADAYCFEPYSCAAVVGLVATYATVLTAVCTPYAGVKAWKQDSSFKDEFRNCWYWHQAPAQDASSATRTTDMTTQSEEIDNAGFDEQR